MVSFILQPLRLMIGEHILLAPPVSLGRYYGIYPPSALRLSAWFDPATSAATFTAGMAEYAEIALVGPLARAFAREAPGATLCLLPATGRGITEQLESGAIDVAVAFVGNRLPAHIDATVLLRDPFVVVARQDHPVAAQPMSLEAYAAQNHALVSPRGDTTGALDHILVDFWLKRRIALLPPISQCRRRSPAST